MQNIYAQIGTSKQQVGGNKPSSNSWVEMTSIRPLEGEYIATKQGLWQEVVQTLEEAKSLKSEEVNVLVNRTIEAGFWYTDASFMEQTLHFSFEVLDQTNFNSAMNAVNLRANQVALTGTSNLPEQVSWNGYIDATHTQLVTVIFNSETFSNFWLYAEVFHKNTIIAQGRAIKDRITQATSIEELNAIEISF